MVYLYAGLGIVMLGGIMAIFEMGMSLTGQSMLTLPVDSYFLSNPDDFKRAGKSLMQNEDVKYLNALAAEANFEEKLVAPGLCEALNEIDIGWIEISNGRWKGGCQRIKGFTGGVSHRMIIIYKPYIKPYSSKPYQLFSCSRSDDDVCVFELE